MEIEGILVRCDEILEKDSKKVDQIEEDIKNILSKHGYNNKDISWET